MGLLSRTPSQLHQILSVFESQQERIVSYTFDGASSTLTVQVAEEDHIPR